MKKLKEHFINSFVNELGQINGTEFEYLCKPVLSLILKEEVLHKGHNLYCKPVGYTADFISSNYNDIGQCGTELNYFNDFGKPIKDIDRCILNHINCKTVYLFANQRASGKQLTDLDAEISKKWPNMKVIVNDAEKIANLILVNIVNTSKVEEILNYLPKSLEYYRILPQTNNLPSFKTTYYPRFEEKEVLKLIETQDFIQIYGISGIGKTELSISLGIQLQTQFDSVIWINGDQIESESFNLTSVKINKFNTIFNLEYFLQEFKVLLIVDNLNINVKRFTDLFESSNQHKSKCIITSLQRNLPAIESYELSFLNDEIAQKILLDAKMQPQSEQVDLIINEVHGYPLVLNLIISAIEVDDFTWEEIITEINSLKDFPDSRNVRLSQRIVGKFVDLLETELQWIKRLDNRKISRHFLESILTKRSIIELKKRSLIKFQDTYFYDTHQIILDSIKSEVKEANNKIIFDGLESYLHKHNEIKSIGYYRFLLNHKEFIKSVYDLLKNQEELKKHILYALLQSSDSFNNPEWFLQELRSFKYEIDKNYYDLMLYIEKSEIELFHIDKNSKEYEEKSTEVINKLKQVLEGETDKANKVLINHHIGKLYFKNKQFEIAEKCFNSVLEIDEFADYSRLQLARLYINNKNLDLAMNEIDFVFSQNIDIENQSLSILLSFYELLSKNELSILRSKYIDNNIELFIKSVLNSIDSDFDQPYKVIEKLSSHLSYMQKDVFNEICQVLPFPTNIDENRSLRFSFARIKLSQYKMLKYEKDSDKNELAKILKTAEKYFLTIDFESDFERKLLLDLYIASEQYDKALKTSEDIENKEEPFYLQNMCKIFRGLNLLMDAIDAIDRAILYGSNLSLHYKAAFLNDKAETLYLMKDKACIDFALEAMNMQNNEKTKKKWKSKRDTWISKLL